jgi:predicted nucleic acid-binding protein
VPSAVLVEALTGDHRRDFQVNRLLRACQIRELDESLARAAARLRTATGRAGTISAVDAIVIAHAASCPDPVVLTGDVGDLTALAANTEPRVTVTRA